MRPGDTRGCPDKPRRCKGQHHVCGAKHAGSLTFQSASVSLSPRWHPQGGLSAAWCLVATPVRRQSQHGTMWRKARAIPSSPSAHITPPKKLWATTALDGQATTRRPLPWEGPHHALGRGPAAAAAAVAAAGSGGLPASLTSGAGEADGNNTLCCMALTFLRASQWKGGRRREGTMRKQEVQHKGHIRAMGRGINVQQANPEPRPGGSNASVRYDLVQRQPRHNRPASNAPSTGRPNAARTSQASHVEARSALSAGTPSRVQQDPAGAPTHNPATTPPSNATKQAQRTTTASRGRAAATASAPRVGPSPSNPARVGQSPAPENDNAETPIDHASCRPATTNAKHSH